MMIISVFYAITWLPANVYYVFIIVDHQLTYLDARFYVAWVLGFLYVSANPFIYAIKFDPVRKVLRRMIPCKNNAAQHASDAGVSRSRGVSTTKM